MTAAIRLACAALFLSGLSSAQAAGPDVEQTKDFKFWQPGINMWGSGVGLGSLDKTWDLTTSFSDSGSVDATVPGVPSTGVEFDYDFDARIGLEAKLQINAGTVDLEYPVRIQGTLPETVLRNEVFNLKIANVPLIGGLGEPAFRMDVTTPQARFMLDAILEARADIGPGKVTAIGYEVAEFDEFTVEIPEEHNRIPLVDVGSGSSSIDIPAGAYGTVTLAIPEGISSTVTQPTASPPNPLPSLVFNFVSETKFLNLNIDLDAMAQTALGVPGDVLEGEYILFGDGAANDKKKPHTGPGDPPPDDGNSTNGGADLSIQYKLLDVAANLGLQLAQEIVFQPDQMFFNYVDLNGEVVSAYSGDTITVRAPNRNGLFEIPASAFLYGKLTSKMGFVVNADITVQALQLALHNEFGINFDLNLAEILGFDSEYLIDEQIPDGGLSSAPVYLFEQQFNISGLTLMSPMVGESKAVFTTQVIPETSSLLLTALAVITGGIALQRRRWRTPFA